MAETLTVDPRSASVARLQMKLGSEVLAEGAGSYIRIEGKSYLVTALHNLTGRRADTGAPLSSTNRLPISITTTAWFHDKNKTNIGSLLTFDIPLYKEGDFWKPNYYVHPSLAPEFDVALVPIEDTLIRQILFKQRKNMKDTPFKGSLDLMYVNEWGELNIRYRVGDDIFVVGFPVGLDAGSFEAPLWKHGIIAADPFFREVGGALLVEVLGKRGLSGGPVFCRTRAKFGIFDGAHFDMVTEGIGWIGCYSGRLIGKDDQIHKTLKQLTEAKEEESLIDKLSDTLFDSQFAKVFVKDDIIDIARKEAPVYSGYHGCRLD